MSIDSCIGNNTIRDYHTKRPTFGVTCSPYLATQVLHQLAADPCQEFPVAAQMIENSFLLSHRSRLSLTVRKKCQFSNEQGNDDFYASGTPYCFHCG